jgi:hypothetical protein
MYAGIPVEREDLLRQGGDFAALFYELEADQGVSMIRGF